MSGYHTAQICKNGHVITSYADEYTYSKENYCSKCGTATITHCPKCLSKIRGREIDYGYLGNYTAPAYCYNCGQAYPWTLDKLEATQELLALDSILSTEELNYLSSNLNSLLVDTPKTNLVATKFKISLSKISKVTASAIRDIVVDIASESAKKIIFGE